jgi:hypothetical protein
MLRRISSEKEKTSSNLILREHATIMVSMVTSLLIVPLSVGMRMMKRRSTSPTRRRRTTREVTSPTRRSPMVKLTLDKNGTPMMRAPTPIVTVWQPWLSRESLLRASLSSKSSIKGNIPVLWKRKASAR